MLRKIYVYISRTTENLLCREDLGLLRLGLVVLLVVISTAFCAFSFEIPTEIVGVLLYRGRFLLAPFSAILLIFMLGAEFIQDVYQLNYYGSAVRYLFASIFGLFLPVLKVSNGTVEPDDKKLLDYVGGPGYLNIEHGNVVVLERLESPSSILGTGRHLVSRFNRIKNVASLVDQDFQPEKPIVATTKDGIVVEVTNLQIRYRVYTGHKEGAAKRTIKNPYPYSIQAVRNMTYNVNIGADDTSGSWQSSVFGAVVGALTGFINAHLLDRVIYPRFEENDSRSEIAQKIEGIDMREKLKSIGAELLWYDLGQFQVADDIEERRREARFANLLGMATVIRAQGEAEITANQERGRAEGQVNLLSGIIQALSEAGLSDKIDENLWNIVLARTAQVIESMATNYESIEHFEEDENDIES